MILTQRLFTAPDTTPRTGGIVYTIQAVIEDIPLNTSLSFRGVNTFLKRESTSIVIK